MIKNWINRAIVLLEHSLQPMPIELNELDWKETLSPNNEKLTGHLSAFANLPGGGFMVFGVEDSTGKLNGITQREAATIIEKLSNLGRDSVSPVIKLDHSIEVFKTEQKKIQQATVSIPLPNVIKLRIIKGKLC